MLKFAIKLKKLTWFVIKLYILKREPVIIFAPGRVGSMALHKNLNDAGVFVFKLEFMHIGSSGAADFVKKHIISKKKKAKIITIVRDPLQMLISYFFSKASANHLYEARNAWINKDVETLQKLFIRDVLNSDRLDSHLYWYERDFLEATGIDIFSYPFDLISKTALIEHEIYPTLVLRSDINDADKASTIGNFLNLTNIKITRENTRSEKADAELYETFKNTLVIPTEILNKVYESKVCRHFFTINELERFKKMFSPQSQNG